MPLSVSEDKARSALETFKEAGGTLRTSEALGCGIHPRTLYHLRDTGHLERLSRGLYRLVGKGQFEHEDLVIACGRVPEAVVTLLSALAFHGLTDEIPHAVYLALPRGKRVPRLEYPPLEVVHVSAPALRSILSTASR